MGEIQDANSQFLNLTIYKIIVLHIYSATEPSSTSSWGIFIMFIAVASTEINL